MQITWHGIGCFTITGKLAKGEVSVVTDPYDGSAGLKTPRTLKGVMGISSSDSALANNMSAISGQGDSSPFFVTHAGEYEVQDIFVTGIHAPRKDGSAHTIFRITVEGMNIAYLGSLDRKLKDAEIEKLGDIHILILPVGNGLAKEAPDVVSQIEPRIVIPSHFKVSGMKGDFVDEKAFCKELACPVDELAKLKIKKSSLPTEDMQLVVLKKS